MEKNKNMFYLNHKGLIEQESSPKDAIPEGISKAPLTYTNIITKEVTQCIFKSGFVGIQVADGFITPYVGWAVVRELD